MDNRNLAAKYNIAAPKQIDFKDGILVIEDQTDLRLIIQHQLGKLGFTNVRGCANGYEAVELIRDGQFPVGAFICDLEMPIMGGLDFLSELRENPSLDLSPFCISMEQVSKERLMLAVEHGVDEILVKPFTLNDITPKLRSAFAKFHNPANPEKVYELAKREMRENRLEKAELVYQDLALTAPKAARPLVGLARVEIRRKNFDAALSLLDQAEAKNASAVHVYVERANVLVSQSKWEEAVAQFKKAIELSPLNALRYKEAADILFRLKRYSEAVQLLNTALKYNLEFPDLFHYLSQANYALRDFKAAGKFVRRALAADPENLLYLNQLGVCLKEQKLLDEAQKVYNQIIKLDPTNAAALYNKAVMLFGRGNKEEAIKLLERALQKHPGFAEGKAKLAEFKAAEVQKPEGAA